MNIKKGKRVLLRTDLNVPLHEKQIICDHKLQAILPTIDEIKKANAKVVLITHLHGSTIQLVEWFEKKGYAITFEPNLQKAKEKSLENINTILLLENVRSFNGEKNQDPIFAKKLADLGDYYINDAFGVVHRNDTSITILPQLFDRENRFLGPLIKKEMQTFKKLKNSSKKPFVLVLGGGKPHSKIPLIENLLTKVQSVLLCPAIVFTFLKYQKKQVGKSLVDNPSLPLIPKIIQKAKKLDVHLLFPKDYQVAKGSFDCPTSLIDSDKIPYGFVGLSIGPKTIEYFSKEILNAKTVFFNGSFGNIQKKETLKGMKAIYNTMTQSSGYTVIGGGDSVAAAYLFGVEKSIDYLSTGGGAALAYLSSAKLPGLEAFKS